MVQEPTDSFLPVCLSPFASSSRISFKLFSLPSPGIATLTLVTLDTPVH